MVSGYVIQTWVLQPKIVVLKSLLHCCWSYIVPKSLTLILIFIVAWVIGSCISFALWYTLVWLLWSFSVIIIHQKYEYHTLKCDHHSSEQRSHTIYSAFMQRIYYAWPHLLLMLNAILVVTWVAITITDCMKMYTHAWSFYSNFILDKVEPACGPCMQYKKQKITIFIALFTYITWNATYL